MTLYFCFSIFPPTILNSLLTICFCLSCNNQLSLVKMWKMPAWHRKKKKSNSCSINFPYKITYKLPTDGVSVEAINPFIADNKINDLSCTDFLLLAISGSVPSVISQERGQKRKKEPAHTITDLISQWLPNWPCHENDLLTFSNYTFQVDDIGVVKLSHDTGFTQEVSPLFISVTSF